MFASGLNNYQDEKGYTLYADHLLKCALFIGTFYKVAYVHICMHSIRGV
jgi:hypothetical protein